MTSNKQRLMRNIHVAYPTGSSAVQNGYPAVLSFVLWTNGDFTFLATPNSYRSRHPQQSDENQENFKKFKIETILMIPGHIGVDKVDKVDIWLQNEVIETITTTRLWAVKGKRPRAITQQQFEYAYLLGSDCPGRWIGEAIVGPWVNKDAMGQIPNATEIGRCAVVFMDGAGWQY